MIDPTVNEIVERYMVAYRDFLAPEDNSAEAEDFIGSAGLDLGRLLDEGSSVQSVQILSMLAGQCINSQEIAYVGAGPVEDYILAAKSPEDIQILQHASVVNDNLLEAIDNSWIDLELLPDDVREIFVSCFRSD